MYKRDYIIVTIVLLLIVGLVAILSIISGVDPNLFTNKCKNVDGVIVTGTGGATCYERGTNNVLFSTHDFK